MQPTQTTPLLSPNSRRSHYCLEVSTAIDDAEESNRPSSILWVEQGGPLWPSLRHSESNPANPYEPLNNNSMPEPRRHELTNQLFGSRTSSAQRRRRSISGRRRSISRSTPHAIGEDPLMDQMHHESNKSNANPKTGLGPRPVGGNEKLDTFSGVFVPTSLNVLSILMFLRFGFILGQGGVLGIMVYDCQK